MTTDTRAPSRARPDRSATFAPISIPPMIGSNRNPAWNASAPCTAWNNCGSTNSNPISAKDATRRQHRAPGEARADRNKAQVDQRIRRTPRLPRPERRQQRRLRPRSRRAPTPSPSRAHRPTTNPYVSADQPGRRSAAMPEYVDPPRPVAASSTGSSRATATSPISNQRQVDQEDRAPRGSGPATSRRAPARAGCRASSPSARSSSPAACSSGANNRLSSDIDSGIRNAEPIPSAARPAIS